MTSWRATCTWGHGFHLNNNSLVLPADDNFRLYVWRPLRAANHRRHSLRPSLLSLPRVVLESLDARGRCKVATSLQQHVARPHSWTSTDPHDHTHTPHDHTHTQADTRTARRSKDKLTCCPCVFERWLPKSRTRAAGTSRPPGASRSTTPPWCPRTTPVHPGGPCSAPPLEVNPAGIMAHVGPSNQIRPWRQVSNQIP